MSTPKPQARVPKQTTELWSMAMVKEHVDTFLADFYKQQIRQAAKIDPAYQQLWQSMEKLALAGGKRIRPYLCVLAYQAFGGEEPETILAVAAAQELLHTSLLIHDDIIDRDTVRYGIANVSGQFQEIYAQRAPNLSDSDRRHFADGAALLAGDLLLSSAHSLIAESQLTSPDRSAAQQQLQASIFAVAGGELLDSETVMQEVQQAEPIKIAEYKTAGYSFVGPLLSGAALAQADQTSLAALRIYAINVGIAFQLADDILGVFGDSNETGKTNTGDLEEGKRTYLLQQTMRLASSADKTFLDEKIGDGPLQPADVDRIRSIMNSSGALQATQKVAADYANKAMLSLDDLTIEPAARQAFAELAQKVIKRAK